MSADGRIAVVGTGAMDVFAGGAWHAVLREPSVTPRDVLIHRDAVVAVGYPQLAGVWRNGQWRELHRTDQPRSGFDYWWNVVALGERVLIETGRGVRVLSDDLTAVADRHPELVSVLVRAAIHPPPCRLGDVLPEHDRVRGWNHHFIYYCADRTLWVADPNGDTSSMGRSPLRYVWYLSATGSESAQVLAGRRRLRGQIEYLWRPRSSSEWQRMTDLPAETEMVLASGQDRIAITPSRIHRYVSGACAP